jgi:DNA polymerase
MLIGEGPGEKEDEQGRPFVGRSGTFLDAVLTDAGLSREELFITSSVKCRPPENRNPAADEMTVCRDAWLNRQIACVQPRIVVLMGLAAIQCVLGEKPKLKDVHGQVRDCDGMMCMLTYHPTAGMRFPKVEAKLRNDLRKLASMLD